MKRLIADIKRNPWGYVALLGIILLIAYAIFLVPTNGPKPDPEQHSTMDAANFLIVLLIGLLMILGLGFRSFRR